MIGVSPDRHGHAGASGAPLVVLGVSALWKRYEFLIAQIAQEPRPNETRRAQEPKRLLEEPEDTRTHCAAKTCVWSMLAILLSPSACLAPGQGAPPGEPQRELECYLSEPFAAARPAQVVVGAIQNAAI